MIDTRPDESTHWQFPDNAWFAIFMWAAGPEWVIATTDRRTREPVREVREAVDGSLTFEDHPFTPSDQNGVDDDLDEELERVGIPPRPRGVDWYLSIAANRRELIDLIGSRVEASIPSDVDGAEYLPAVRAAMELLVRDGLNH